MAAGVKMTIKKAKRKNFPQHFVARSRLAQSSLEENSFCTTKARDQANLAYLFNKVVKIWHM